MAGTGFQAVRAWVGIVGLAAFCATCWAKPPRATQASLEDAELTDVFFRDPDSGWAVGDRGAIWHTDDGGRRWQSQRSPVACRLESVCFVDDNHGWAAGGWTTSYTHRSRGVLLRTTDGGRHWAEIENLTLPALQRIHFDGASIGWAIGHPSSLHPSGVFNTTDGGRSWSSLTGIAPERWQAGDVTNEKRGVVVGDGGAIVAIAGPGLTPVVGRVDRLTPVRAIELNADGAGWLVGDLGLVQRTRGGQSLLDVSSALPASVRGQLDFQAVAVHGQHCWIAGKPGSCVLHSADFGQTWDVYHTEQTAPLRSLTFIDENRGWAVGALGTILATRDGGRTWSRQRGRIERAAVLAVFADAESIPLELFAHLCGNEAYVAAAEVVHSRDTSRDDLAVVSAEFRSRAALVSTGLAAVDFAVQFPGPAGDIQMNADALMATWDELHDGRAIQRLEERLVRAIRTWRPDVIVTHAATDRDQKPAAFVLNQALLTAVGAAAQSPDHSGQLDECGLTPWKVKRVFAVSDEPRPHLLTVYSSQIAPRLAVSLSEHCTYARSLLHEAFWAAPESTSFHLLIDGVQQGNPRQAMFSGLAHPPGSDARRTPERATGSVAELARMAQRQRNIRQLIARRQAGAGAGGMLGQIDQLTQGLSAGAAGDTLFQLAETLRGSGRYEMAAEVDVQLVRRQADHPNAEAALYRLLHFHGSSEQRQRVAAVEPSVAQFGAVVRAAHLRPTNTAVTGRASGPHRAVQIGELIHQTAPTFFTDPRVRFLLASAQRRSGDVAEATRFYTSAASAALSAAWRQTARAELFLREGRGRNPKPEWPCRRAASRPHLDGRFDDAVWREAAAIELKFRAADRADWPAAAKISYDDQFLLLAVTCRKPAAARYSPAETTRPRDADLRGRDRVRISLDIDRDYATYYQFTLDHRGWLHDACGGDASWDPTWYVAADETPTYWSVEAAIPLDQLTGQHGVEAGDVWSIGVQRIVPGVGLQSWTQEADTDIRPERFGHLQFE